jgi:Flp pilus assembly protein TadD
MFAFFLAAAASLAFGVGTAPAAPSSSSGSSSKGSSAQAVSAPVTATDFYAAGYKASQALRWDEAITDFQSAISLKPDYAEAYNMLGYSLRMTGNAKEAFVYYDKAIALKPNFPEAREYYGEAFLAVDDVKDAVRQYIVIQKAGKPQAKELLEKIDAYLAAHPGQ